MTPYLSRMAGRSGSVLGVVFGLLSIAACAAPAPSPSPSPTPIELGGGPPTVKVVDAALSVAQFRDWIDNAGSGVFFTPSYNFTATTIEIWATLPTSGDTDPESHSVVVNRASGVVVSYK